MPELPEVEVVKRGLEALLPGRTFERVEQRRPDLRLPFPADFGQRLQGHRVVALDRRAKYILVRLSSAHTLVIHLGMTGRLIVSGGHAKPATLGDYIYDPGSDSRHDHVAFRLSGGLTLAYNDPRRFGVMLLVPDGVLMQHPLLRQLGVEPLDAALDAAFLSDKARGRRSDLKAFLIDQRIVAGLGNIYVCEALHAAGLSPLRSAGTLATRNAAGRTRATALVTGIKRILAAAIEAGGSTLRDYRHTDGSTGSFQERFLVYDREGEPCSRSGCTGTIRRIPQAGRSTFYCPRCQR